MKSQENSRENHGRTALSRRGTLGLLAGMMAGGATGVFGVPAILRAASVPGRTDESASEPLVMDLFDAMTQEKVDVRLAPKDSKLCRITLKSRSDQPLRLKMPDSFATVPQSVWAQWDGMGPGGMGPGGMGPGGMGPGGSRNSGNSGYGSGRGSRSGNSGYGNSGGMQSGGGGFGGMGGMGGMGGGMMGGMGMYNLAPERTETIQIATVCLEHGKAEPKSSGKYKMFPLETISEDPVVSEICKAVSCGAISQRVGQAAAWHCVNEMSWEELAAKEMRHAFGVRTPYFASQEIQAAILLVRQCERFIEQRALEAAKEKAAAGASESDA